VLIEAGHFALTLALGLSLVQCAIPLWGTRTRDPVLMGVAAPAALTVFTCIAFAFATLTFAYVSSDFSVVNVVENSHSAKPFIYKLTGVWGNHEGSMLLWVLILTLF
jgi:cytochrome c-type biogenesis protein CcmF